MNALQLLLGFGVMAGLLPVLAVVVFGRLSKRFSLGNTGPRIAKTIMGGLGIGNIPGPT